MLKFPFQIIIFASTILIASLFSGTLCKGKKYQKTNGGVIVFHPVSLHSASLVKLNIVYGKIIHVITSRPPLNFTDKRMVAVDEHLQPIVWKVIESKNSLSLQTSNLNTVIQFATSAVNFTDKSGKTILKKEVAKKNLPKSWQIP